MKKLATPDFTPAQILSAVAAIGTQAVAYQLLASGTEQLIVSIAGIVVPAAFLIGDAIVRHGRAAISVAQIEADVQKFMALLAHHGLVHTIDSTQVTPEAVTKTAAAAITQAKST